MVERQRDRDRRTLLRMAERHHPDYTSDVELVYEIGSRPGEDRVRELRTIMPKTPVPFVVLRPSIPDPPADPVSFEDVEFDIRKERGHECSIQHIVVEDAPASLRYLICFSPSITRRFSWSIQYVMPRLWDPFRLEGEDRMTWTVMNWDGFTPPRSHITNLRVSFIVSQSFPGCLVERVGSLGNLTGPMQLDDGRRYFQWDCENPDPVRYEWRVIR